MTGEGRIRGSTEQMKRIFLAIDCGVSLTQILLGPDGPFCDKVAVGAIDTKRLKSLESGTLITPAILRRMRIFNMDSWICRGCRRCVNN